MIELAKRSKILSRKKIIASEIHKIQKSFYDEELLQEYKDSNEEHVYWEMFDALQCEPLSHPKFEKIIGIAHSHLDSYTDKLSEKIAEIFQIIGAKEFVIVSHLKLDFFGNRNNTFKPLQKAYAKLEKIVGANTYIEAFVISLEKLPDFIEILFWIVRCDPEAPEYIFVFDVDEQTEFFICKYGNLHITEFGRERFTENKLKELGWKIFTYDEHDQFSEGGEIIGREIIL